MCDREVFLVMDTLGSGVSIKVISDMAVVM